MAKKIIETAVFVLAVILAGVASGVDRHAEASAAGTEYDVVEVRCPPPPISLYVPLAVASNSTVPQLQPTAPVHE